MTKTIKKNTKILKTKNRNRNNQTKKIRRGIVKPSLKILRVGYPLYASKKFEGNTILEYNKKTELESGDHCLLDNSSWFGNLQVAKSYKKKDTHIYKWKIKTPTNLLRIDKKHEGFIDYIFKNTHSTLTPAIALTEKQLHKIKYIHPYLIMTPNEKSLYEFKFAFGYITLEEQYEFLKLVEYLLENKFIIHDTRDGNSILPKIKTKINYYRISSLFSKKNKHNNRLSFYIFDKHSIMNLCRIVYSNKEYKISGVYQKNNTSFWFPDLIVYKMNIEEYILFNPHHNLVYDKIIE
jgi:hypothetical protein